MPAPCKFQVGEIVRYISLEKLPEFYGKCTTVIGIDLFDNTFWRIRVRFSSTGTDYNLFERRFETVEHDYNPVHRKIKIMFERQSYYKNKE